MQIKIKIWGNYTNINRIKKKLKNKYRLKLTKEKNDFYYVGNVSSIRKFNKLKLLCKKNNINIKIDNDFSNRSNNYRETYFKYNSPIFNKYYRCVYCGRFFTKNKITIDHIYSIKSCTQSIKIQNKLIKMGADNVNSVCNLVAACKHCNSKKGAKIKGWIWKARLGKLKFFWPAIKIIKSVCICIFLYYFCHIIVNLN